MDFYFDHVATTAVKPEVFEAMKPWLTSEFGNPSSHYSIGYKAKCAIEIARETVAKTIGADPDEIFFTSCGSEANTWAMTRLKKNYRCSTKGEVLVSPIEHHSVLNAVAYPKFLDVNIFGKVQKETIRDKIKHETYLVSCMMVNNEVGTIQPINDIAKICEDEGIFFHVDAVQALGHIPINVRKLPGVTTMSFSGHKIGAPKGIGFLYIRKDAQEFYQPLIFGGQQERGLRGGTENVAFIVGLAKACELLNETTEDTMRTRGLAIYCWDFLRDNIPNVSINGYPMFDKNRVANILNVSIKGIRGEELVEFLNEQGFYISTGSACNSDSEEPSHVLKAIGRSDDVANSSIRISFDNKTKLMAVNSLCQKIVEDVELLREE